MLHKTLTKMTINIVARAPGAKGFSSLYFFVRINGKQCFIPTKIKVLSEAWDKKKKRITARQLEHEKLNGELTKRKGYLQKVFDDMNHEGIDPTIEEVKQRFQDKIRGKAFKRIDFFAFWDTYVDRRRLIKSKGYIKQFGQVRNWLREFRPNIQFKDFTIEFYNDYVNYLIDPPGEDEEGLENGTIRNHIAKIKAVLKEASMDRTLNVPHDFLLFDMNYASPKPFWLNWDTDLPKLEAYDAGPKLNIYKEEFLFRCYTGLRHSDVHHLTKANFVVKDGSVWLDYTMIKTKLDKNIELNTAAVKILKKWNYSPPRLDISECDRKIKDICEGAGLSDMIEKVRYRGSERIVNIYPKHRMTTTHTARRTFARRWMELGGSLSMLSKYMGHSSEKITSAYIGWEAHEVNEEMKRLFG